MNSWLIAVLFDPIPVHILEEALLPSGSKKETEKAVKGFRLHTASCQGSPQTWKG